jgi:Protein of unknown function (DUF3630)
MTLPLERLSIQEMASGELSLLLTDRVQWESFPDYATAILHLVGGSVVERADGPAERVWTVSIGGQLFWLACDEIGVSLDSKSRESTLLIASIHETLLRHRSQLDKG